MVFNAVLFFAVLQNMLAGDILRLDFDGHGEYLGEFHSDDRILVVLKNGEFYITDFDANNHYEPDILYIEKYAPDKVWTAIVKNVTQKGFYYIKRFLMEATPKKNTFVDEHKDSAMMLLTCETYPLIQVNFGGGDSFREPLVIDAEEFALIKGFKASTNKAYRRLIEPGTTVHSAATLSQPTGNTACSTEGPASPRTKPDRKHGLLWSIGYTDGILGRKGQLDNWLVYLRDNPRRLLMKRLHPEFFRVQRHVKVDAYEFSAIGNRYLLTHPVRLPVQCSRRLTEEEIVRKTNYYLEMARRGAVLVSPSISPGEKAIMRAAFDAGYPLILLQENGFTDLAKPGGARFDACAEGRLLILAPWEHHNQRLTINRSQCLSLNEMARIICE